MRPLKVSVFALTFLMLIFSGAGALDRGLVGFYRFDSGSGSNLEDDSGYGNDGSVSGASWVSGVNGSALSFDGSDDGVTVPGSSSLSFDESSKLTTTAWVKFEGDGSGCCNTVVGQRDVSAWALRYDTRVSSNELELIVYDGKTWMGDGDSYGIERPPLGEWHFIAGVYNGDRIKMYKDGELIESYAFSGSIQSSGSETTIGTAKDGKLKGNVDRVRIYNRALSSSEINDIYSNNTGFCNARGPENECIMNKTNILEPLTFSVNAFFQASSDAVLKSPDGQARINITNSSSISGLWRGSFFIDTERPRIVSGASFHPSGGDIVIGS